VEVGSAGAPGGADGAQACAAGDGLLGAHGGGVALAVGEEVGARLLVCIRDHP
jgi:hypothetical protein